MKKIALGIIAFLTLIITSGCSMDNTPTKKVENYLNNYKSLNETVLDQLDKVVDSDTIMTASQKNEYKDILKRQYQNLTYKIKDEVINGNDATVNVEIEVYDYYKINKESDSYYQTMPDEFKDANGKKKKKKYIDYKLEKLKNYKERVTYTIDFYLKKVDKTWVMQDINEDTRSKIHGLYAY